MANREAKEIDVVVVGSFIMDFILKADHRPAPGETIIGREWHLSAGGKGFNQAVAAARAGAKVAMVGMVGQDDFGDRFVAALKGEGINSEFVFRTTEASTGVGAPIIDFTGANSIIIVPGANMLLKRELIKQAASLIAQAKVLLIQLEIPLETCLAAACLANQTGAKVILTPAPVPVEPLPGDLLEICDLLIPNEVEVYAIAGITENFNSGLEAASSLLARGAKQIIVTLGNRGAVLVEKNRSPQFAVSFAVPVVDTVAAGDAFTGNLAIALAHGYHMEQALRWANAAGALTCTRRGSSTALPTKTEIQNLLSHTEVN